MIFFIIRSRNMYLDLFLNATFGTFELHKFPEDLFDLRAIEHEAHLSEVLSDLGGFNAGTEQLDQVDMLAQGETCQRVRAEQGQ